MFAEYIQAAMDKATYEIIDDPEPFYGEVPELKGLWATGKTHAKGWSILAHSQPASWRRR